LFILYFLISRNTKQLSITLTHAHTSQPPTYTKASGLLPPACFGCLSRSGHNLSAPAAALRSPALYENLALFDAIRAGNARERALAQELFEARLSIAGRLPNPARQKLCFPIKL
jgi:hypothetical protein